MESSALSCSKFPPLASSPKPSLILIRRFGGGRRQRFFASASAGGISKGASQVLKRSEVHNFASLSSSSSGEVSTASGTPQFPVPTPPAYIGSPLFWIGVGVGISVLFSMVATKVKQYALQQAFKTMMGQPAPQNDQFSNSAFSQGMFPPKSAPVSSTRSPSFSKMPSASHIDSRPAVTVDVPATKVETTPPAEARDEPENMKETHKYAFVDVSPDELQQKDNGYSDLVPDSISGNANSETEVISNGAPAKQDTNSSTKHSQSSKAHSVLSVEALEKMMEDPTVQKMVYPYLSSSSFTQFPIKMGFSNKENSIEDLPKKLQQAVTLTSTITKPVPSYWSRKLWQDKCFP